MAQNKIERQKRQARKQIRRVKRVAERPRKDMSDAARLQRVVLRHLEKHLPPQEVTDNVITLAMMITGILRGRSGQLKKIVRTVQYAFKKESLVDRFRRFVRNQNIEVKVQYAPIAARIIKAVSQAPIVLMIDSTKMGGQCLCLMVSVYYKSRALPLAWVTYKGTKGHSSQQLQLALFKQVQALLPSAVPVTLLGDGEFDGSTVVDWFNRETTWDYVCRTDSTNQVFYQNQWRGLHHLPFKAGEAGFLTQVRFTRTHQVGPVNILVVWHEAKQCHWFFVTNCLTATEARTGYALRFTTETLFSDWKGRGFHLDETRLWLPERLNRLILAGAIAYVFMVALGVECIVSGVFRQLVRTDAFYHSLFQLGLIYLDHILNEFLVFPLLVDLPPPHTFEHTVIP